MAETIRIDTKYAKRDIQRMNRAIEELGKTKKQYHSIVANLESMYKGNASNFLQAKIAGEKIKQIDQIIGNLKTAREQLSSTVKKAEAANAAITKMIKN